MLGSKPVVGHEDSGLSSRGQCACVRLIPEGRAQDVATAVQVQDSRGSVFGRGDEQRRDSAGSHRTHVGVGWR